MKTTTLSIVALLCVSLSHAGTDLSKNILQTPGGSFGSVVVKDQVEVDITAKVAATPIVQYKHSSFKAPDGGTVCLVKFYSAATNSPIAKVLPIKDSRKIIKENAFKMTIYPNPARNEINIRVQDEGVQIQDQTYIVRIKNLFGQDIFEQKFEGEQFQIDASQFAKGFFLVEVTDLEARVCGVQKVVIQ